MAALLHTFGIDWRLLLAQTVNFGVLMAALVWLLYTPVLKIVRERQELIAKGVEDARKAGEKLASADGTAALRVASADTEAGEIVARARAAAGAEKTTILEEARSRSESLEREARSRAAEEAARALRESEREVARLAILAAEKVMRQS